MDNRVTNVVVAGLGGQGVLKAAEILAGAAFRAGFDVKQSEIHGMSQRGGAVCGDVRFGRRVDSPMIPDGEVDILVLLAQDQLEAFRWRLRDGGILIDAAQIDPQSLANRKSINVALLGVLSAHLPLPEQEWRASLTASLPESLHEANWSAFCIGRAVGAATR